MAISNPVNPPEHLVLPSTRPHRPAISPERARRLPASPARGIKSGGRMVRHLRLQADAEDFYTAQRGPLHYPFNRWPLPAQ